MPYWLIGGAILGGAALLGALLSEDDEKQPKKPMQLGTEVADHTPSKEQLRQLLFNEYKSQRKEQTRSFLELHKIKGCKFKPANRYADPERLLEVVQNAVYEKLAPEAAKIHALRASIEQLESIHETLEDLSSPANGEHR